ncbi:uncharacterized protein LOC106181313 [Lingula anatina]|uniref:Uncharacterized protein LOC106181313 n=1 Tax=Lingula anatina TaxID=7574 RepID=A0A1S3KF67_LINAN|nr:uncharacterized protein LOC106181313 [Lingula anatina]|eukprot:XP_013421099.1 uncharacterized protein LOC106181313 [Lingula anatina]
MYKSCNVAQMPLCFKGTNGDYSDSVNKKKTTSLNLKIKTENLNDDLLRKVKQGLTKGLPIVHHDGYVCDHPVKHRFAMRKFQTVFRHLRSDSVISVKQVVHPDMVGEDTLAGVHKPEYIQDFFNGTTSAAAQRKTGFKWSEGLVKRCRFETGGTITGARLALEVGMASSTAGGTHHAFPDYGSGFCLINDMAVATDFVLRQGLAEKVLIVDLDVHQGDGTAYIFRENDCVFTFSMHGVNNFPVRKQQSDLDVELPDKTGDKSYMERLQELLPHLVKSFRPDLVVYDAGVDPHEKDELGRLCLTDQGLFDRDYYVLKYLSSQGCPCVTVIGGGYAQDVDLLGLRHTIIHRAATKVWQEMKGCSI